MLDLRDIKREALRLQNQAAWAFRLAEYETAFELYTQAEERFRQCFSTPGDRVYFMQTWGLRCLDKLVEEDPDLIGLYHSKCEKFLAEWTEFAISAHITPKRVSEALVFRSFSASYHKASRDFSIAATASRKGDLEHARAILEDLIKRASESEDPEADALCALARSKIKMLAIQHELRKRPQERNLGIVASDYLHAARVSRLPLGSRSSQRMRFSAFRASFLSNALMTRAFVLLREMRSPEPSLTKAKRYLARSVKYAETAASVGEFGESHSLYSRYWHELVSERVHLIAFMSRGNVADIEAAVQAWRHTLNAGEQMCAERDEEVFFPNRFYCLDDLRLEGTFLAAAKAFRERRWPHCIRLLEGWRKKLPQEYSWSWRDVNVHIRLLGTMAINAITTGNDEAIRSSIRDLMCISQSEPAGSAARYFADGVTRLPQMVGNEALLSLTLESLAEYFVFDSGKGSNRRLVPPQRGGLGLFFDGFLCLAWGG